MTAAANRVSTYTSTSAGDDRNGEQKNLWTSMLGSVASGKRLPEKNVLVLGALPLVASPRRWAPCSLLGSTLTWFRRLARVPEGVSRFAFLGRPAADDRQAARAARRE